MARHRSFSSEFKRQLAKESLDGRYFDYFWPNRKRRRARWRTGRDSNRRYRFTFCFARAGPEVAGFSRETYRQLSREDCSP
jgi:hypothetical protein